MDGKKTEAFTVKVSDEMARFVKALSDFNLLSVALGIKGNAETIGNKGEVK